MIGNIQLITTNSKKEILAQFNADVQRYMKWFLALTEIPHPTFQCQALSKSIQSWLRSIGATFSSDKSGNILIHVTANGMPETSPTVAIQAHIDMVWVGELVDGTIGVTFRDGKVFADESTLGADDGFGVAMILEIAERRNELVHGPLELLLTVDEEMGLKGIKMFPAKDGSSASNFPVLKYKYFINCDSLCGDKIYIGSAGAIVYQNNFIVNPTEVCFEKNDHAVIKIDLTGCTGGHSGQCIHLGRINAIKFVARLLNYLNDNGIEYQISELKGGDRLNIIPPHSHVEIIVNTSKSENALEILNKYGRTLLKEFETTDSPNLVIQQEKSLSSTKTALSVNETKKIVSFITLCPSGNIRMSPIFQTVVDTSHNLGVIHFVGNEIKTELLSRSATRAEIENINQIMRTLFDIVGLEHRDNVWTAGVPWEPNVHSKLAEAMANTYEELYGVKMDLSILHVTIEPPQMQELGYTEEDMISICPAIPKAHSIGEFMDVEEAVRWRNAVHKLFTKLID